MGRGLGVEARVVQHEVFEVAVDPQQGAGVSEVSSFEDAGAGGGAGDTLVDAGQRRGGIGDRPQHRSRFWTGELAGP